MLRVSSRQRPSPNAVKVEVLSFIADVMLGECEDEDVTRRSTRGLKMLVLRFGAMWKIEGICGTKKRFANTFLC